jgi:tRNA modification GTPase
MLSATKIVELTPRGRAAVAVVLVEGPDATRAVDRCFQAASGRALADTPIGRVVFGRWRAGSSPTQASLGEEVIACRSSADRLEVHCHGGFAAVAAVIGQLSEYGCQRVSWQDWVREAALDPIRAAAQIALAEAPTARVAAVLLDQWHGALGNAIRAALAAVDNGDWRAAAKTLDDILRHRAVGAHLATPWRVVLAGPPNVGKSSLKNALVGYQRSIVCDLPGTTRDVVTTTTAIDGWPVQLADTAGLRDATDEVEAAGVAQAEAMLAAADLVVFVDEAGSCTSANFVRDRLSATTPTLRVLNKIDLVAASERPAGEPWDEFTSALGGEGVERLVAAIGRRLVPSPPAAGAAVPFTAEQVERLTAGRAAVERRDAAALGKCLQPLVAS